MKFPIPFLVVFLLSAACCTVNEEPSYETLRTSFENPPRSAGLNCWWWWLNGNVDRDAITSDLEAMSSKGFQGAMIFDAGGFDQRGNGKIPAGPRFGSEEWTELFTYALDEAERLGLEIGFNIQSGWNLGGPGVTPEQAAKRIVYSETKIRGGRHVRINLDRPESAEGFYRDIAVLAVPLAGAIPSEPVHFLQQKLSVSELGGSAPDCRFLLDNEAGDGSCDTPAFIVKKSAIADVSHFMDEDGILGWDAPEGEWALLRFGYTCTGAQVSTSSDSWKGLVLDYLSPTAIDSYLTQVIDPILEAAGRHVGTTLTFMETDSWECGGMNWTDRFPEDFEQMNGYSVLAYLPVVAGYIVDDMESTHAFLADFRKTVGHDVAHKHYARFADYAHSHGMGIQPESAGPHAGPFDGVRNYSFSDIVMSEFWAPSPHRPRDCDRFFLKQASSAAHIYGRKIVGAESFTTIGPHWNDEIWRSQKPAFDHEICAGLNRVYFHTFTCSPACMGLPGQEYFAGTHINPRLTWWDEADGFMSYMTRVQSVVQGASFNADVLYYYGDHIPVIYPFKHADLAGCMPGFDYDVTSEDALLRCSADAEGRIVSPSGMTYRLLVMPDHKTLSLAALRKVRELLDGGVTVLGFKPVRCVSLVGGDAARQEFSALADEIWGDPSPCGERPCGKGTVVWGVSAREHLLGKGLREDFSIAECPGLEDFDFIHYSVGDAEIFYVANLADSCRTVNCSFRVSGRAPELWNALDGSICPLEGFSQEDGCTSLPLRFEACGSAIVVFGKEIAGGVCGSGSRNWDEYRSVSAIDGPWTVSFDESMGAPAQMLFPQLEDWTKSEDEGVRYYSGAAHYSATFDFDGEDGRYFLQLGSVKDVGMARVSLNGTDCGIAWTSPFRVEVTKALKKGSNELCVKVVNSWYNRVAGDQLNSGGKQYTSTNIALLHDFRGRELDSVELMPSGLLGPVELVCTD